MPGQTSTASSRSLEAVQRGVQRLGALARLDGEVGPADVADEERIAAQERQRRVGARAIAEHEREVLWAVSRRRAGEQLDGADGDRIAARAAGGSRIRHPPPR